MVVVHSYVSFTRGVIGLRLMFALWLIKHGNGESSFRGFNGNILELYWGMSRCHATGGSWVFQGCPLVMWIFFCGKWPSIDRNTSTIFNWCTTVFDGFYHMSETLFLEVPQGQRPGLWQGYWTRSWCQYTYIEKLQTELKDQPIIYWILRRIWKKTLHLDSKKTVFFR